MKEKTVCIVTATRAEWGLLRPVARQIRETKGLRLLLAATGTHFCSEFGNTYQDILSDGFTIDERIDIQLYAQSPAAVSKTFGLAMIGFADLFTRRRPDMLLILGDRYEALAVACAASIAHIPIAHLHGGETTEGALDEGFRHAITKLSYLHFTSCEAHRQRVIQLGESPRRVFNTGAPGIDNIREIKLLDKAALSETLHFDLQRAPYAVVTFHPATQEPGSARAQVSELLQALDAFPELSLLFTKSNADAGGGEINLLLDAYAAGRENALCVSSLGSLRYLSALRGAQMAVGNSSSGIIEAPYFGIPTVNIGDRQRGRMQAGSILNCAPIAAEIIRAVQKAQDPGFLHALQGIQSLYGDGHAAEKIADVLQDVLLSGAVDLKKPFYDLPPGRFSAIISNSERRCPSI